MRKLILYMLISFVAQVHGQNICGNILFTEKFEPYVEAVAPLEVTSSDIVDSARLMQDALMTSDTISGLRGRPGIDLPTGQGLLRQVLVEFQLAVGYQVRGWFKSRDAQIQTLMTTYDRLAVTTPDAESWRSLVEATASNPVIEERVAVAPFVLQEDMSLWKLFLLTLYHEPSRTLSMGPREVALTREALQYAHLAKGDRVIQLGVESPSVLTAMKAYLGNVNFEGVSLAPPTAAALRWANAQGVNLKKGHLGQSDLGTARLVLGLDGIGAKPGSSTFDQLTWLKSILQPNGTAVLVYDYQAAPDFTLEEAKAGGLQILSWGRERDLPEKLTRVMYGAAHPAHAGHLRAYVLRLGDEDVTDRPATVEMRIR